jgi:hypothetical protein
MPSAFREAAFFRLETRWREKQVPLTKDIMKVEKPMRGGKP